MELYNYTIKPIYQLATDEKSFHDFMTPSASPAQIINGIKDYFDVTTPEGAGHLTGTIIFTAATIAIGAASAGSGAEAAASDASRAIDPPGALDSWVPKPFEEGDTFQRYGDIQGHYGAPVGHLLMRVAVPPASIGKPLNIIKFKYFLGCTTEYCGNLPSIKLDWDKQFYFWPSIEDFT